MKKLSAPNSLAGLLASSRPTALALLMRYLSESQAGLLLNEWGFWGRGEQQEPEGGWRAWLFMGGRGAGKTRAGAEWVAAQARARRAGRIALIGPTFHDVREVMVEGQSGLRSLERTRPRYEASRKRLVWANGAQGFCFSAEDPESLRGPQFDAAWCDELCYWAHPDETLATLEHGLRLGQQPRLLVTTTPRPIPALKRLLAAHDTVVTRSSTWANAHNVAAAFITALNERWAGNARLRQELLGELVEDFEGALWTRADIEAARDYVEEKFEKVVVAIDPPVSSGAGADACGIVAAASWGEGAAKRAVVLADATVQGVQPHVWAARAAELAESVGAQVVVAESNNGGELVREVLCTAAPHLVVKLVHASIGKRARAEPIALLYAQKRVKHAAAFPALEDEMCAFGVEGFKQSPDRVDALVWALTDLLLRGDGPRVRFL